MESEFVAGVARRHGARLLPSLRRPSSVPWEGLLDIAAAIAFVAAGYQGFASADAGVAPVLLVIAAAVCVRRRFPLGSMIAATVTSGFVLLTPEAVIAVWTMAQVVLFSAALRVRPRVVIAFAAVHAAALYVGALVTFGESPFSPLVLITPVWTLAVTSFGFALRTQRSYVAALEQRADDAARGKEAEAQRRIGEERLRIARDLHDSLAHSIAVAGIHALAADATVDSAPELAHRSLRQIHDTMRTTQAELQGILRVLRVSDADRVSETVAGQAGIPALIDSFRALLQIESTLEDIPDLDGLASTALFRLVQEGLTNAHKHGAGEATLYLTHSPEGVRIVISNPIDDGPTFDESTGFGLIGMRERVEAAGGRLTVARQLGVFSLVGELPFVSLTTGNREGERP
ncbi:sensor histidine kinase [Leifsonia poae]|uniref:sensor histidine kinase n=1 Tax=Leifsonia poae TaxID=110933 RepID=UPI001CBFBA26|nr:histidine kinase [Leifsonia poae]